MKKARIDPMILITCIFAALLIGFFVGRNSNQTPVQIRSVAVLQTQPPETYPTKPVYTGLVNINTATAEELQTLPGIGPTYSQRIIDYREENGPFQTIGELANVEGIGEKRLEAIWDLVTTGG